MPHEIVYGWGVCGDSSGVFFLTCEYYLRVRPQDLTGAAKRLVEAVTFCAEDDYRGE